MSYLLDTCVVSEFTKRAADPGLIEWLALQDESSLYLSDVTLGELEKGLSKLSTGLRRRRLRQFVDQEIVERFAGRVLPVVASTWRAWGVLCTQRESIGRPVPVLDALLAAQAREHRLALVTRNERDFTDLGVDVVNPWTST